MKGYEKLKVPHVLFGIDTAKQTGLKAKSIGMSKCLVVTDKGIRDIGLVDPILETLKRESIEYIVYDKVLPNPPDYSCIEAGELLKSEQCDGIIAIGGGSSLDTAKVANLIANIPEKIEDLHDYSMTGSKMNPAFTPYTKLIAIPTTSGTGAEATCTGVITDTKKDLKYSIGNENCVPDMCIIDPLLTIGMPAMPTAICGIDVLCHVLENMVGMGQNDYTDAIMYECASKAWKWLPIAVKEPRNIEARSQVSWASHNALCNGVSVNGHAMAHGIGAKYHLVHGHACAVVIPAVIRHHALTSQEAIKRIATIMGIPVVEDAETIAKRVADRFVEFYKALGLKTIQETFKEQGVEDSFEMFVEKVAPATLDDFKSRLWQPPIHDNPETMRKVLEMIYYQE
ncbi:iron-containing alcohol dehydrogenase [Clostridium nigeriense]|uniref:iron-containing alcohol dehydrogenase n=1 Tax=Clostridium nigeriense TaxID=1805470 RepID=UPI003D3433AB